MRLSQFVFGLILIPALLLAQTNVDRLVSKLDSLSSFSFDNWKVSPDLKVAPTLDTDPTKAGFDDSRWETLKLNQWIYPDSCWLRKEIVVPELMFGKPVSGSLLFLVSVDDYGYLWVNGESKGYFPWNGEFELTKDARPGQKFLVAIKAINTGGPLRLIRAQIQSESARSLQDVVQNLSLSLRVGQKLLSFDTYQTNSNQKVDPGIDKSTLDKSRKNHLSELLQSLAGRIDLTALKNGDFDRFRASIDAVRPQLKPVQEFVKNFTLFLDSNAHIDAAWLWRKAETVEVVRNTFSSVITMMQTRPDFTYTQSSAAYYEWMRQMYPGLFKKIQESVATGRWEVIGGMWVEPDCNLPSGESWARQLLYAKQYFRNNLGTDVKIGWNPDSFGYNWNMPMFYRNAGIDAFITQKIGWNATNVFPYRLFWWESADGSRILSYFPFDYVNTIEDPYRLVDWLRQFEANTGFRKMMILFGVGDHGGGPSLEMLNRIDRLRSLDIFPTIEYGTATQYLSWIRSQDLRRVPTWDDELYLEYHQGTYTTQAKMKWFNRTNEVLLSNAEEFSTLSTMSGGTYNSTELGDAWKKLLFNQFHDILPGSSIREVYVDATEDHKDVQAIGTFQLTNALDHIARQVNTSALKKGTPVVLFNPLSWERTDIAHIQIPPGNMNDYTVYDGHGKQIPAQMVTKGRYDREIIIPAHNVPPVGYTTVQLRKGKPATMNSSLNISRWMVENGFFTVSVDSATGWVESILDRRTGKEILHGPGNELQLLEDLPTEYDAWNIGLTGVQFPSTFRAAEVVERGPVRVVLRLTRDYLKPGVKKESPTENFPSTFFTQDIILYDGIDRIDFRTEVDWWEEHTMLKVAFPLAVTDTIATYEIPFGVIKRSTRLRDSWEKAKVEVPASRWADVSASGYGVSLLNNAKYGYDIKGNVIRLSLLRSPKSPDPTADRGRHSIEYALYPHAGSWQEAGTVHRGYQFNSPIIASITDSHKGIRPPEFSFMKLGPANVILTSVKKAEASDAWILRWYDTGGKDTDAVLQLPKAPTKVMESNFLEEDGPTVSTLKGTVHVPTRHNGVVTLKVYF